MAKDVPALVREVHRIRKHLAGIQDELNRLPRILKVRHNKFAEQERALEIDRGRRPRLLRR